jgi:hypothetical protein
MRAREHAVQPVRSESLIVFFLDCESSALAPGIHTPSASTADRPRAMAFQ